ncbi:hypothetical protein SAMN02745824_0246 [Parasphingorhabdus marina DSM 22363]|uniref:Uncharacterized protein n=1 Tax=Parasphingorhabdus marina DSM 22363 TaxID=1123272 RepID=A0A1N6CMD7_9SPHN|nr:hypothetical protein [Parasphingorhabdus marina]SIN59713.1 hypothetical protein SAMN02745824_0246 [Parasphingorhabdus marina DSM 22363]
MQLLAMPQDRVDRGLLASQKGYDKCGSRGAEQLCARRRDHPFRTCARCGTATHWTPRTAPSDRMGVNMRLFEPEDWQHLPVRKVDGASF